MADSKIRYCRTADGIAIAYTTTGSGPPLLYARRFLAPGVDDELVFSFSAWEPLARIRTVVLWDPRGSGLSEGAPGTSFDQWMLDLEAVAATVDADRFDLGGELTPCHLATAFAVRHTERVNRVILWNPTPSGFSPRARQPQWLRDLARDDWDMFADVSALQAYGWSRAGAAARFAERLRQHFSYQQYERMMEVIESIGAGEDAANVTAPALVIADLNFLLERGIETSFAERQSYMRRLVADMPNGELAIVKAGDPGEAGRIALRFLEPGFDEHPAAQDTSGTATILFTDIADSTALTERMGDIAFRDASRALDERLRAAVRECGGTAIDGKVLGDGVMAVFTSAAQAIDAASRCLELSAASELQLHIGIHAGDVIRETDNVYGGAVNIASRICGLSRGGEVLVSATIRDLARTSAGVTFEDRGEHALKGIDEPQRVYAVRKA